jgi:hypothetical protein
MPTHRTTCRVIYGDTDNMGHACLNRAGKVIRPPRFIKEIIEKSS